MANYRDDRIRAEMAAKNITLKELAERIGISPDTLSPYYRGTAENAKVSTLRSIADELGIPWIEMFEPRAERVEA